MAGKEIDDNPFKPEDNLKLNDWCPLDLLTAAKNACNKLSGKKEVVPIVSERSGKGFNLDPVSMVNQVVNYDSSSLDAKIYKQCAPATVQIKGYSDDHALIHFGSSNSK